MVARLIFCGGRMCDEPHESVLPLIKALREKIKVMHSLRTDDLLDYIDGLGKYWSGNPEIKKHVAENLNHLVAFMSKNNTKEMLATSLRGNYGVLDEFVELSAGKLCHAQPRGLAVHWLAGNVQILGIFSILQALLTKNVSLIKASSRSYEGLVFLLDSFRSFDTEKIKGADIANTMNVVLVEHDDKKNQRAMSMNADIRIVWGGAEAVDTISGLKKRFFCEDIIYGPKYSYALVDGASLAKNAIDIARRFAFDISTFDQYACSSPHTIFVEHNSEFEPAKFAELLAGELDKVNRLMIPKGETDAAKVMDVLNLRTEFAIKGKVFSSKNTDWTLIYSEEGGLAEPCFSRVVFVRPIKDIKTLAAMNDRRKQTVGLAMENLESRKKLVDEITLFGVDRCPKPGHMTLFESPWDGMFGVDRMVRWVTTWK